MKATDFKKDFARLIGGEFDRFRAKDEACDLKHSLVGNLQIKYKNAEEFRDYMEYLDDAMNLPATLVPEGWVFNDENVAVVVDNYRNVVEKFIADNLQQYIDVDVVLGKKLARIYEHAVAKQHTDEDVRDAREIIKHGDFVLENKPVRNVVLFFLEILSLPYAFNPILWYIPCSEGFYATTDKDTRKFYEDLYQKVRGFLVYVVNHKQYNK